jgi:hypothetical protein
MAPSLRAPIQVLVLLLAVAGLAACEAGNQSGPGGDGSLHLDGADAGARPDYLGLRTRIGHLR